MVGWHHRLNGHEFEQVPGVDGQWSLACCNPWGRKESDMTKWLNWTELMSGILEIKGGKDRRRGKKGWREGDGETGGTVSSWS